MHRLKLRRAVYGAALGVVLYHLLASLIFESIRGKPNGQDTAQQ